MASATGTVAAFLGSCLRDAAVRRVFGPAPLPLLDHLAVSEPALASLLADAAGRVGPAAGVALLPGNTPRLRISSRPGGMPNVTATLADKLAIAATVEPATRAARRAATTRTIALDLDLDDALDPRARPRQPAEYLPYAGTITGSPASAAMLVGPGVARRGAVDGLRAFAAAGGISVANTWGAKGVFEWDSPHHAGTCGLQARDFELLGFDHCDLLITSGLDQQESQRGLLDALGVPIVDVAPEQLDSLATAWPPAARPPTGADNKLYQRLAAIAQPGYLDNRSPLHPARAVAVMRAALPPDAVLCADPGEAGLWVARTFPTSVLGSVIVPATRAPGIAAALALCLALDGRAAFAVMRAPLDDTTREVMALAAAIGSPVRVCVWGDEGASTPEAFAEALASDASTIPVAIDWSCTDQLIEAAGPVVAWT